MSFPEWPRGKKHPEKLEPAVSEELLALVGTEEAEEIERAVTALREVVADMPRSERSLKAGDREFVIPLSSHEQKGRALDALYGLSIFPWEENGQLIIDHHRDLDKLRAAGFVEKPLEVVSMPVSEPESRGGVSSENQFPLPYDPTSLSEKLKERSTVAHARKAEKAREFEPKEPEEDDPGIDTELREIINDFDQGKVDPDDPVFVRRFGHLPSLRLFPQSYVWENGAVREKRSGKELSKEDRTELLAAAKEGDADAMNKLVRMHTGLVLKVVARVAEKYGGDPDDLFQEGMLGLMRSIQVHDPEKGSFASYAMLGIEQRMRRFQYEHQHQIRRPIHLATSASELRRAKEKVTAEGELRPEDVFEEVPRQLGKMLPGSQYYVLPTGVELDRLERLYLLNAAFDPVSDEGEELADAVHSLPPATHEEMNGAPEAVIRSQIAEGIQKALLTLSPREERVLRMRFGINERPASEHRQVSTASTNADGMTFEEIGELLGVSKERIRQIEAKGLRKLKLPSRSRALDYLLQMVSMQPEATTLAEDNARRNKLRDEQGW